MNSDSPATMGIRFEQGVGTPYLYDNYLLGAYGEALSGALPGGALQASQRWLQVIVAEDQTNDIAAVAQLRNVGTQPLALSVASDASWLEGRLEPDTLTADQPVTKLGLRLMRRLAPGDYSGALTITPLGGVPVKIGIDVQVTPR